MASSSLQGTVLLKRELTPVSTSSSPRLKGTSLTTSPTKNTPVDRLRSLITDQHLPKVKHAANQIESCCTVGIYDSVSVDQIHLVAKQRCKHPLCPWCHSKQAQGRRDGLRAVFDKNPGYLQKCYPYTMTFTLRHSEQQRKWDYSKEVAQKFNQLRGNNTKSRETWESFIDGGFFVIHVKWSNGPSPHIHGHALLLASQPIEAGGTFEQEMRRRLGIDLRTPGFELKPAYWRDNQGKNHTVFDADADETTCLKAIMGATNYLLKTELENLDKATGAFIEELLRNNVRRYRCFGILSGNKKTDKLQSRELRMQPKVIPRPEAYVNQETGEVTPREQTQRLRTRLSNTTSGKENQPVALIKRDEAYYEVARQSSPVSKPMPVEAVIISPTTGADLVADTEAMAENDEKSYSVSLKASTALGVWKRPHADEGASFGPLYQANSKGSFYLEPRGPPSPKSSYTKRIPIEKKKRYYVTSRKKLFICDVRQ